MFQRLVFTLATAGSLIGLAVLYSVAMRPIVVIPIRDEPKVNLPEYAEAKRPAENVRVAATYIPFSEWATESKYMLKADQAFVYTQEWRRDEQNNKRVRFTPFATVWLTTDKNGKEEAVSIASDSATLEFAAEFDEKNPNPGRVVGAILSGRVKIGGPDGLEVVGDDFFFEEVALSLYTTNPVRFRFQSHQGYATQMRMKLIAAEGLPGLDRPHVYGVESVRLIGGANPVTLKSTLPQGKAVRPVKLRCAGDLVYTVASSTAVFNNDVRVWAGSKGDYDSLECDFLTMQFAPKTAVPSEQSAPVSQSQNGLSGAGDFQKFETNLEFSWLLAEVAEGKRVRIHSESHKVDAWMHRLAYDAETQVLVMSSEDPKTEDPKKAITVVRNGSRLWAPEIQAHLRLGELNPLYSLLCLGMGELSYVDEKTNRVAFRAKWKKQLSKKFDEEKNLDLIQLDEDAFFGQKDRMTGLLADQIKIWLVPLVFGLPATDDHATEPSVTPEPEPKQLLALGDVSFKSPQLVIKQTNELDIRFDEDGAPSAAPPRDDLQTSVRQGPRADQLGVGQARLERSPTIEFSAQSRNAFNEQVSNEFAGESATIVPAEHGADAKRSRTRFQSSALTLTSDVEARRPPIPGATSPKQVPSKFTQVGFANVPAIADGNLGPPVEIPSESSAEPIVVLAKRIAVRLQRIADQAEPAVREVHSEGKVTITQARKPGEKPMRLEGDTVDVKSESEKHELVHVLGTPALIHDRGFEIEGKNIHLDRGSNRAWVDGAGRMSVDIPSETKIPGMDANLQRRLTVRWDESMNFDGLAAEFFGRIEAKLGLGKMQCEQMIVKLAKRLSFQADQFETSPALHSVECMEKVKFEYSAYVGKNVDEIYRGWVSKFDVNYVTGKFFAQGPGEIRSWQRQKKGQELPLQDTIQANRPILVEVTVWDFTGIQFEGTLKGHFEGQNTGHPTQGATIDDRVQVVYGPVKSPSPSERIDPDKLPSRAGTIRCDQLQFVNHAASDRTPIGYHELFGYGNTEIEGQIDGRRFTASADEIIFDGSKGLYVLRARGRQTARLNGVGYGNVAGQEITFNPDPKLKYLHVVHATEGQGSR